MSPYKQAWVKVGNIFDPASFNLDPNLESYAANPVAVRLKDSIFRVFYSGRNKHNKSSIGAIDIDLETFKVLKVFKKPLATFGITPNFYSDGISLGNFFQLDEKKILTFMGWSEVTENSWKGSIGYILLDNNLLIKEIFPNPVLSPNDSIDPVSLSYPCVVKSEQIYMWYGSTSIDENSTNSFRHKIHLAVSNDGTNWLKKGAIKFLDHKKEYLYSRPTTIVINNSFLMWYSYRLPYSKYYKIGFSKSTNGFEWSDAKDSSCFEKSDEGWDSEMIEYPYALKYKGKIFIFYNGNNYGQSGIGIAYAKINDL
tara:strand:- start:1714 stop:2646 length:933 start_codon:yes stop_codon:yes gene_type:complete